MADLPKVLAGPILRRCTETMVTVWLATSVDLKPGLELAVYDASNVKAPKAIDVTTDHQVVKAGANLFVHLVVARPKATSGPKAPPFPRGKLLGYEVLVVTDASVPESSPLHSVPLSTLLTTETLHYGTFAGLTYPWPTFFLQAEGTLLRVLHGSCRRAYASGRDAMAAPDTLIKDSLADVTKRPTLMILTGDQIYADDILWAMWSHTSNMARKIMGYDETAPVDGKLKPLSKIDGRRDLILKNGLTTDDGENHLIGFSEYAAYYLVSWSETLWDDYKRAYGPKGFAAWPGVIDLDAKLNEIDRFRRTLPAVRRGLANVPTYMIFDDHDVTDDWNIDQQFEKETTASPLGTRLITCALYAYWLFQAWGNDPDTFDAKFVAHIQAFCDVFTQKQGSPTAADTNEHDDFIRTAVGPAAAPGTQPRWSYVVPCTPPIFVLDTRTSRQLEPRGNGPGLLNATARRELKGTIAKAKEDGVLNLAKMPLVMVSATPFCGVQYIELLQRREMTKGKSSVSEDLEFWRNNLRAHADFVLDITKDAHPASIVFLSGDVHYGFTGHTELWSGSVDPRTDIDGKTTGRKSLDIYQLTSSAFKNEKTEAEYARHAYSSLGSEVYASFGIDNDWVNYLFDKPGDVSWNGHDLMDILRQMKLAPPPVYLMNLGNVRGAPLLVPQKLFESANLKVNRAPLWREEVHLFDHRHSSGLFITAEANVGLVTLYRRTLTHELYGLYDPGSDDVSQLASLAPRTWGPAQVSFQLKL